MSKNINPLNSNVLLRKYEKSETEKSGLSLPPSGFADTMFGVVIECGPSVKNTKAGDIVVCPTGVPINVTLEADVYMIIKEKEILAKIVEK